MHYKTAKRNLLKLLSFEIPKNTMFRLSRAWNRWFGKLRVFQSRILPLERTLKNAHFPISYTFSDFDVPYTAVELPAVPAPPPTTITIITVTIRLPLIILNVRMTFAAFYPHLPLCFTLYVGCGKAHTVHTTNFHCKSLFSNRIDEKHMFRKAKQPSSERSLCTSLAVVAPNGIHTFMCYKRQQHPDSLKRSVVANGWFICALRLPFFDKNLGNDLFVIHNKYSNHIYIYITWIGILEFRISASTSDGWIWYFVHIQIRCDFFPFFYICNGLEFKRKFAIFLVVVQ